VLKTLSFAGLYFELNCVVFETRCLIFFAITSQRDTMKKLLMAVAFVALSGQAMADESVEVGKKIYNQAFGRGCGTCHDVAPNPNLVKNINEGTLDEKKFATVIKEGRNTMPKAIDAIMKIPAVEKAGMTEDQAIDALFKYLKHKK
jgi:cytochrome c5